MKPEEFKHWRKSQGLTQQQAASTIGISRRMVINYEQGNTGGTNAKDVDIPLYIELACAAIAKGITHYSPE